MPRPTLPTELSLPADLTAQLTRFRRRLWWAKLTQALRVTVTVLSLSLVALFFVDRWIETPIALRWLLLLVGTTVAVVYVPWTVYRWLWGTRRMTDLARILSQTQPRVGDALLGVLELVQSHGQGQASRALCQAAIDQVARDTRTCNLLAHVSPSRQTLGKSIAAGCLVLALACVCVPGAGRNAVVRWALPWWPVPRYTFAQLELLPDTHYVPRGEAFELTARLADTALWRPRRAQARYGDQTPVLATREDNSYTFAFPPQTADEIVFLRVGDATVRVRVFPTHRPELSALRARVDLPDYLQYPQQQLDVRSGAVSLVAGSHAVFQATINREVTSATSASRNMPRERHWTRVGDQTIQSPRLEITADATHRVQWQDLYGMAAQQPFVLQVRAVQDAAPTLQCFDMPHEQVVLADQAVSFTVKADDDYGLKRIGVEWSRLSTEAEGETGDRGQILLAGGSPQATQLEVVGTFTAEQLGIAPEPLVLRVFAEDYLPGRPPVYSPPYTLYVMTAEQHAVWITGQLQRWERQVLEVRDTEQRLFAENQQLAEEAVLQPDARDLASRITAQVAAERGNVLKLQTLHAHGGQLIAQATRNPQLAAAALARWAQMLQGLGELGDRQMPLVAQLLQDAAAAAQATKETDSSVPAMGDIEMSSSAGSDNTGGPSPESAPASDSGNARVGLPGTTVVGGQTASPSQAASSGTTGTAAKLQLAVDQQQALMEQFREVMDELTRLMGDLQGSTFVKRLKHASRREAALATSLQQHLGSAFGLSPAQVPPADQAAYAAWQQEQQETISDIVLIQDDLQGYYQRTRQQRYDDVYRQMRAARVTEVLQDMVSALDRNQLGETIGEAEYWADRLSGWADQLVATSKRDGEQQQQESAPGGPAGNLPPAVLVEVLRLLHAEMDLRALTRTVEQVRVTISAEQYNQRAQRLASSQDELRQRLIQLAREVEDLQLKEDQDFRQDLLQLYQAGLAMEDAQQILMRPETGTEAVAAENEAIEALLATRRGNGQGGGAGGSRPGRGQAGGGGTSGDASPLDSVPFVQSPESRAVRQASGAARGAYPDEFRDGLDAYFSEMEQW